MGPINIFFRKPSSQPKGESYSSLELKTSAINFIHMIVFVKDQKGLLLMAGKGFLFLYVSFFFFLLTKNLMKIKIEFEKNHLL